MASGLERTEEERGVRDAPLAFPPAPAPAAAASMAATEDVREREAGEWSDELEVVRDPGLRNDAGPGSVSEKQERVRRRGLSVGGRREVLEEEW